MVRLGVQANELAEKLDVTPAAVSNWMTGVNEAKGKNLRKLSEILACDPHWLTTGEVDDKETLISLKEVPAESELELWKRRARTAEKQLDTIRNMLRSVLEMSSPTPTAPPSTRISSTPPSDAQVAATKASSSATTDPSE
jgi:transcriptional regulator with XRE-family HTH domain